MKLQRLIRGAGLQLSRRSGHVRPNKSAIIPLPMYNASKRRAAIH